MHLVKTRFGLFVILLTISSILHAHLTNIKYRCGKQLFIFFGIEVFRFGLNYYLASQFF
jgi:hypothetical protein